MLKLEWRRLEWWYWVVADVLLALALLVDRHWFVPALAFNLLQAVHIAWRRDSLSHFSSQVRVGYCPLARMLSLLPWNRVHPFTLQLVVSTFLAPPRSGSIRDNPSITA